METYIQIGINSLCNGLVLSLIALGFTYIFYVTKVFHLAHAGLYSLSGLITWKIYELVASFLVAFAISVLITLIVIWVIEKLIYLPLTRSKVDQSISLISSMGIYTVIVNFLALIFGNENRLYSIDVTSFELGEIVITSAQYWQIIISGVSILLFTFVLKKWNLDFRAISDSELKASLLGINIQNRRLLVFILGTVLICFASFLHSLEFGIKPDGGMSLVLTAAVVSILITRLNISLIVIGAIALSVIQNVIEWNLNAQWSDGLTFFLLLLVILFKTEGLISYNLRKDST